MKRLSSIFALVLILLGSACEQDKKEDKYKIRGRILESCDNPEPVEGVHVGLQLDKSVTMFNPDGSEYLDRVLTGPNGEFVLSYDEKIYSNIYIQRLRDGIGGPNLLMMGLPHNKSLNVGNLFYNRPTVDVRATIRTPYPFGSEDTLVLGGIAREFYNGTSKYKLIPGPFTNGKVVFSEKDRVGTVQTFLPDSLILENQDLIDLDYNMQGIPYHFKGHQDKGSGVGYYTNSCETINLEIRLDSTMLGK